MALAVVLAGAALFFGSTRRLSERLRLHGVAEPVLAQIRRTGLPLLGLAFFVFWAMVYVGLWWSHPQSVFTGLDPHPRFADFFYYAVSTAFISPPGDILAHSRGARSATMIEMLTAFALLTTYLSSFVDWGRAPGPGARPAERAGVARSRPEHRREILVAPASRETDGYQLARRGRRRGQARGPTRGPE